MSDDDTLIPPRPCPICGKPRALKYRPFCSKRCAQIDLGRWLGEVYTVPASEVDEEDEDMRAPPPRTKEDN